jgi:hypothetical protein
MIHEDTTNGFGYILSSGFAVAIGVLIVEVVVHFVSKYW